ncbi:hypothetical protein TrRE_jg5685, partial [Triparma retinervis]
LLHTREVVPSFTLSSNDLVLANILIGALCRPSMVSVLVDALKEPSSPGTPDGGVIVFSGIRPSQGEVDSLKDAYKNYIDFDDCAYKELSGADTRGSVSNYGFDVGDWCRVVGRRKVGRGWSREMSEAAIQ